MLIKKDYKSKNIDWYLSRIEMRKKRLLIDWRKYYKEKFNYVPNWSFNAEISEDWQISWWYANLELLTK